MHNIDLYKTEIWLPVDFREGYEVSNCGQVRSLTRYVNHSRGGKKILHGRILKLSQLKAGYLQVQLGGGSAPKLVHRLVAKAFIKNPYNLPCVNHKDGFKDNNKLPNLEWCTYSQNELHSYKTLGKNPNKTNKGNTGILSASAKPVAELNDENIIINIWGSASEAAKSIGTTQGRISCVCRGEAIKGKHLGRRFIYTDRDNYHQFHSEKT